MINQLELFPVVIATELKKVVNSFGYVPKLDEERLTNLTKSVYNLMSDGQFRTLRKIRRTIGRESETGISAALRTFRRVENGGHIVNKIRLGDPHDGLFAYQVLTREKI